MKVRIPLARPEITEADRQAVAEVLRTPYLSMGPKLRHFEDAIGSYTGSKHAVAVNSGTSALQLAIRALGVERGAEVILPSFTFSALLNVILQEGLRPKFVDVAPGSFNTTPELIAGAVTGETRLVLAVHTFGLPLDVQAIRQAIGSRAPVVEDACEALGAEVAGQTVGSIGNAGLLAFYPNKQISSGEGGVLLTSDADLAQKARRLRNQGRDPALGWMDHAEIGFSYRLSEMNCALGLSQLSRVDAVVARRQQLAEAYDRELARIDRILRPPLQSRVGRISWFVYSVMLADEFHANDRDQVCESMLRKGIATARYFAPLHRQPVLASQGFPRPHLPNTDAVASRVIALPFFNELADAEIHDVCEALEASVREVRRRM